MNHLPPILSDTHLHQYDAETLCPTAKNTALLLDDFQPTTPKPSPLKNPAIFYESKKYPNLYLAPKIFITPSALHHFLEDNNLLSKIITHLKQPPTPPKKSIFTKKSTNLTYKHELLQHQLNHIHHIITHSPFPHLLQVHLLRELRHHFHHFAVFLSPELEHASQPANFSLNNPVFQGNSVILAELRQIWADAIINHLSNQLLPPTLKPSEDNTAIDPPLNLQSLFNIKSLDTWITIQPASPFQYSGTLITTQPHNKNHVLIHFQTPTPDHPPQSTVSLPKTFRADSSDPLELLQQTLIKSAQHLQHQFFYPQQITWTSSHHQVLIHHQKPADNYVNVPPPLQVKGDKLSRPKVQSASRSTIITASPAAPGLKRGPARVITNTKQLHRVKPGDILVTNLRLYQLWSILPKVAGIITEQGGTASHLVIYAQEVRKPAVVNAHHITHQVRDNQVLSIDGETGKIHFLSNI